MFRLKRTKKNLTVYDDGKWLTHDSHEAGEPTMSSPLPSPKQTLYVPPSPPPSSFVRPVKTKEDIKKFKKTGNPFISAFKYSHLGIYMALPVFLGLTIGLVLDNLLSARPLLTLLFLFIGVIGSFYNSYKILKEHRYG